MKPIKKVLQEMVENRQTPSVQYMFFDKDSTIFEYRHGVKNLRTGAEADAPGSTIGNS